MEKHFFLLNIGCAARAAKHGMCRMSGQTRDVLHKRLRTGYAAGEAKQQMHRTSG